MLIIDGKIVMRCATMLLFCLLVLMGCDAIRGPQEGDYYEHLGTGDRIKLDKVGNCAELNQHYEAYNDLIHSQQEEGTISGPLAFSLLNIPSYSKRDSAKTCFSYLEKEIYRPGGTIRFDNGDEYEALQTTMARIEPVKVLEEDYRRVE